MGTNMLKRKTYPNYSNLETRDSSIVVRHKSQRKSLQEEPGGAMPDGRLEEPKLQRRPVEICRRGKRNAVRNRLTPPVSKCPNRNPENSVKKSGESGDIGTPGKPDKRRKIPTYIPKENFDKIHAKIVNEFKDVGHVSEDKYYVQRIENFAVLKNATWFLVKWLYWPRCYNSWEPEENMDPCRDMVVNYFVQNPRDYASFKRFCKRVYTNNSRAKVNVGSQVEEENNLFQTSDLQYGVDPEYEVANHPTFGRCRIINNLNPGMVKHIIGATEIQGRKIVLFLWNDCLNNEINFIYEDKAERLIPAAIQKFRQNEIPSKRDFVTGATL